jgi:ATP phosphoribosyltransferase
MQCGGLKLGIPTNKRLLLKTLDLFEQAGLPLEWRERFSMGMMRTLPDSSVTYLRSRDIPGLVSRGHLDLGVTTHSMIAEADVEVTEMLALDFSRYRVVLASRKPMRPCDLAGGVVATSLPHVARQYFWRKGISDVEVLEVRGAVEAYPVLEVADAIVEITETGASLEANSLRVIDDLFAASAVLVARCDLAHEKKRAVDGIAGALARAIRARSGADGLQAAKA